jgi:hypothetical protein
MSRLLVIAMLAACSSSPKHTEPGAGSAAGDPTCPVEVPGTSVTVEDTATGGSLVFVTTGDVVAVRQRAAAFVAMHARHDGPESAMGMMVGTGSTAAASDVDHGVTITFTAAKPDDVAELQNELRMHAHHLANGSCKMMM